MSVRRIFAIVTFDLAFAFSLSAPLATTADACPPYGSGGLC